MSTATERDFSHSGGGSAEPARPAAERQGTRFLLPSGKYARRGNIVFFGSGAALLIGLGVLAGLASFDSSRTSVPKPAASVANDSGVSEAAKLSPSVAEKSLPPAMEKPSTATEPEKPSAPAEMATANPPRPSEAQPLPATSDPTRPAASAPVVRASPQSSESTLSQTEAATPTLVDEKEQIDPGARELIQRGWALYYLPYTPARWQEARREFEQAVEIDSQSSEAWIGLASILSTRLAEGWSPALQEDIPQAEHLLSDAIAHGRVSNRAAARFTLGIIRQMQNRLSEARAEFETAISLDPNNVRAYLHLGETLLYLGQPEAGIPPLEQAIRLLPDDPNIAVTYWALGTCQFLSGRPDEGIGSLEKARGANPRLWVPSFYLAGAYGLQGNLEAARSALADSIRLKPALKSLARMRAENPWLRNPQYWMLQERTLNVGLRRAGLPDQ
jgi:Tfp pilus assembly protein PilF